jgi:DNA-binding NarL/FixJ family response regulator
VAVAPVAAAAVSRYWHPWHSPSTTTTKGNTHETDHPDFAAAGRQPGLLRKHLRRQVLRLAGEGKTSAAIAKLVHLSEGTVRNYLSEAISKLNAGNRIEAYRMARNAGWL